MKKWISLALAFGLLACSNASYALALNAIDTNSNTTSECVVSPDDIALTVTEVDEEDNVVEVEYSFDELSFQDVDEDGNIVDEGTVLEYNPRTRLYTIASSTIASGVTRYWYPTSNSSGFKSGTNVEVTVYLSTNNAVSKTIGLTSGSSTVTYAQYPSLLLKTGTTGYWKLYLTNNSSASITVTTGTLMWGEG